MTKPFDKATAIKEALRQLPQTNTFDAQHLWPSERTRPIKTTIAELGFQQDQSVWASGLDEKDSPDGRGRIVNQEWLFDLCWIDYHGRGPTRELRSLELAMECELPLAKKQRPGAVLDDFEKLIIANADLKLMVFQVDEMREAEEQFSILQNHAKKGVMQNQSGAYLLAGLVWKHQHQHPGFVFKEFPAA